MDPYSAVKITNTYFPVVSDQGKQHLVHYTLSKECKQALPQVRLKNFKRKIEPLPLLAVINHKLKPHGITLEIIEISKNVSQQFLGFVTLFLPKKHKRRIGY